MFWAACTLGYVGFLHLAEFTVATFSALLHLTVKDIAVNGVLAPFCMHMMINVSKTDPLRGGGTFILVWVSILSVQFKP